MYSHDNTVYVYTVTFQQMGYMILKYSQALTYIQNVFLIPIGILHILEIP